MSAVDLHVSESETAVGLSRKKIYKNLTRCDRLCVLVLVLELPRKPETGADAGASVQAKEQPTLVHLVCEPLHAGREPRGIGLELAEPVSHRGHPGVVLGAHTHVRVSVCAGGAINPPSSNSAQ